MTKPSQSSAQPRGESERFREKSGEGTFITWMFWFHVVLLFSIASYLEANRKSGDL